LPSSAVAGSCMTLTATRLPCLHTTRAHGLEG
jgi:hypothetical protein